MAHVYPGTRYTLHYLQTNVRPDVIFEYSRERGLTTIYYDSRSERGPTERRQRGEQFRAAAGEIHYRDTGVVSKAADAHRLED